MVSTQTERPSEENGYTKTNGKHQDHFIERVSSIPVIHDSVSKARQVANTTWVGRWTLSTIDYVSERPLKTCYYYLEPHLDFYGSRSLDYVQAKVPLIEQPTENVIQTLREAPGFAYHTLTTVSRQKVIETTQNLLNISLHQAQTVQGHLPEALQDRILKLRQWISQPSIHEQ
ncbi:hypothetical protein G6F56_007051 [Rhizopus delemar]|nr:hypothetical protein G6F56_007051 [Rhizopus delemar]